MKIKTAEATKLQLDWGLALAVGGNPEIQRGKVYVPFAFMEGAALKLYRHTDPAVCMGLIDTERLRLSPSRMSDEWICDKVRDKSKGGIISGYGKTLAEAVARCIIAMRLGDEFECPDKLGVQS